MKLNPKYRAIKVYRRWLSKSIDSLDMEIIRAKQPETGLTTHNKRIRVRAFYDAINKLDETVFHRKPIKLADPRKIAALGLAGILGSAIFIPGACKWIAIWISVCFFAPLIGRYLKNR